MIKVKVFCGQTERAKTICPRSIGGGGGHKKRDILLLNKLNQKIELSLDMQGKKMKDSEKFRPM